MSETIDKVLDQLHLKYHVKMNRSDFIRRSIQYTMDNVKDFSVSRAAAIDTTIDPGELKKMNDLEGLKKEMVNFTNQVMSDPAATLAEKRTCFLLNRMAEMIHKMAG